MNVKILLFSFLIMSIMTLGYGDDGDDHDSNYESESGYHHGHSEECEDDHDSDREDSHERPSGCRPRKTTTITTTETSTVTPITTTETSTVTPSTTTETSTVTLTSTEIPTTKVTTCPVQDPPYVVFLTHPTCCSAFYMCSNGEPIRQNCPAGLIFDPVLNVCNYNYNVICHLPNTGCD